jgi:hypothetical protein
MPTDHEMRIAELEDTLDHIRAMCESPGFMSFVVDLDCIARVAREALNGSKPWAERPTRERDGVTFGFGLRLHDPTR